MARKLVLVFAVCVAVCVAVAPIYNDPFLTAIADGFWSVWGWVGDRVAGLMAWLTSR